MSTVPVEAIRRQIVALLPVYMNVFMMGCGLGWLPNAIFFMLAGDEVHATSPQRTLIASFSEIGRIVFAIPAGILADKYGRKRIIICVALLHFFTWLGASISTSLYTIYTVRFTLGLATALVNATALISIGEIASPNIRGRLTSVYQIFMLVGGIFPSIVSVLFSSYKYLSWGITLFSIVSLLPMLWVLETPNFLVSVSKLEEAKNNLHFIRHGYQENEVEIEFEKLKKYIDDEKSRKSQVSWVKFLKSKPIRKPLLTGTLLNFFTILTGSGVRGAFITELYPSNDYIPKKYYPLMSSPLWLIIAVSVTFYIDRFSRRTIFMVGAAAMAITNALCTFAAYFDDEHGNHLIFKWIFVGGNILSSLCYGASLQPVNSTVKSELYPHAVKGFCGSLSVMSQASANIIGFQLYNLVKEYFHLYLIYMIFSINSLILYCVVYFLLPEGRGASLTDLQIKFQHESAPCDESNAQK